MKVAILFDGISALGPTPDLAILATVEAVEAALEQDGHHVVRVPVNPDARWMERMRRARFDLAFNLCECVDGVAALEPPVIGVLELIGVPFTGNVSATSALCLRKHVVNALLTSMGLPVPRFSIVRPGDRMPSVGFPAICKPAAEDASIGVEQRSVVRTARALEERVRAMHQRWEEVLVQRYIDGREVNVGIIGDRVLPISEIVFDGMPRGLWRIVSYRSKWETGSEEDIGSAPRCPAQLPQKLSRELQRVAVAAWRAVGGRGYGRCDFRIDRQGRPWLLEVNPNPDIAPDAGLARMAATAGLDYPALIREVVAAALQRQDAPTEERWSLARQLSGVSPLTDEELRVQAEARTASAPR